MLCIITYVYEEDLLSVGTRKESLLKYILKSNIYAFRKEN